MRAQMRASLRDHNPADEGPANRAGLSLATVHPEMVLKLPSPVHPVDAGAVAPDALMQYRADGGMQAMGLWPGNRVRQFHRVELGHVERFICIYVAQAGKKCLVKKQRLQAPVVSVKALMEHRWRERAPQRFRAKAAGDRLNPICEPHPSELARV